MHISEFLAHNTVRLEVKKMDNSISTGTGFFFNFSTDPDRFFPVIITNKHVIEAGVEGKFIVTKVNENGDPLYGETLSVGISNFEQAWALHPDNDVDLCAMKIAPFIRDLESRGQVVSMKFLSINDLPTSEQLGELRAIEDIIMTGYPDDIWDQINNQPIFRKGITATHPNIDFEGKKEFVADIACFPGSSGSPVVIYNDEGYSTNSGKHFIGKKRFFLLGIAYAVFVHTAEGNIEAREISQLDWLSTSSEIPNNLALVIKSEALLELQDGLGV